LLVEISPLAPTELEGARALLSAALPHDPFVTRVAEEKLFGGNAGRDAVNLAAREGGQLAGLIAAAGRWIKLLVVAPDARRRGIGSALLEKVAQPRLVIAAHPGNYLTPGIDPRYEDGLAFLTARGFQQTGEAPNLRVPLYANKRCTRAHAERIEPPIAAAGYRIRRAVAADGPALDAMVRSAFSGAQAYEIARALEVGGVHIALHSEKIVAFAAHDGNNRGLGWFGPAGTLPDHRGKGVGEILLVHCMADVAERGQDETIVAWVGPVDFYRRAVGAEIERTFIQMERP
jgi:GNAT superfamily N-acetyltransferase